MASIEVQDALFVQLSAQAERLGISLDAYLAQLAGRGAFGNGKRPSLSGEELERLLDAESSNDTRYEGTYPRADIYRDHD